MSKTRLIIISLLYLLLTECYSAIAAEKFIYYQAGILNSKNKEFKYEFKYNGNSTYQILTGFVNYADVPVNINSRKDGGDYKKIKINGLEVKKEELKLITLKNGKHIIHFKVDAIGLKSKFASFEVAILKLD